MKGPPPKSPGSRSRWSASGRSSANRPRPRRSCSRRCRPGGRGRRRRGPRRGRGCRGASSAPALSSVPSMPSVSQAMAWMPGCAVEPRWLGPAGTRYCARHGRLPCSVTVVSPPESRTSRRPRRSGRARAACWAMPPLSRPTSRASPSMSVAQDHRGSMPASRAPARPLPPGLSRGRGDDHAPRALARRGSPGLGVSSAAAVEVGQ